MNVRRKLPRHLFILIIVVAFVWLIGRLLFSSQEQQAEEILDTFYTFEQEGAFSSSWELFHPLMKEKFSKGHYIQDRAHVFMNHFGVETFNYTLSDIKKLKTWRISKDGPELKSVYRGKVVQTYKGKYGNFDIHQEVFVVKEDGEWRVLWDYNQ